MTLKFDKIVADSKRSLQKLGKKLQPLLKSRKAWLIGGIGIFLLVFWVLPAYMADAPGQLGYGLKRFEESVVSTLALTGNWRNRLQLEYAGRRVTEATYVATHTYGSGNGKVYAAAKPAIAPDNPQATKTINELLSEFTATYQSYTAQLAAGIDQNRKPDATEAKQSQKQTVGAYAALALLRVEADDAAQISVLTSIDAAQKNIATMNDALGKAPVSSSDVSQLTKLVSAGILSKAELGSLAANRITNRQFHAKLKELIDNEKLPSDLMYNLDLDLVKQYASDSVSTFEAVTQFEQMQRINATIQTSKPSATQQQAIQDYLSKYKAGQSVPASDIKPFVLPIIYGMSLTGQLQANLPDLNNVRMNSDDQALFDSWKGSIGTNHQNLGLLYQQIMTAAADQPELHTRVLARVQTELVDAQKADIAHLVLPPGWGTGQLSDLSQRMGIEVAKANFLESNPNANQQLAELAVVQQKLEAAPATINQSYTTAIAKLGDQVNNFTGTPEQVTRLKELLTTLDKSQTSTVSELRTQLGGTAALYAHLSSSIDTLREEQLISLVELELRSADNARTLTSSVRTELTNSLAQLDQTTDGLVNGLQTRINALDSSHTTLREELASDIQTIQDNHANMAAYVQAQLDAGLVASDQLEATLQTVQNTVSQQATQLTQLSNNTNALTTLVNQVQATSSSQVSNLQSQVDTLHVDQQTLHDAITTLETTQGEELAQLSSQLAEVSVLQTEAQSTITTLTTQLSQAQSTISGLGGNFTLLETTLGNLQSAQLSAQATIAAQDSELVSLQTQTDLAIDELTQSQAQLSAQVATINAGTTNLSQLVGTVQTAATATQTQLDTLLASPPWSIIPEGTYVAQSEFDALQTTLDSQFAQITASLNGQLQTYQQQLDAEVDQLAQTTTTQHTQQQQTINTLNAQVQTLQSQINALSASAPGGL